VVEDFSAGEADLNRKLASALRKGREYGKSRFEEHEHTDERIDHQVRLVVQRFALALHSARQYLNQK
jgi:hypothetical protein